MTIREIYSLIQTGNRSDAQQALFELLSVVQELSTATLELAHNVEQITGRDPISFRPRLWLSEFLEVPEKKERA